MFCVYVLACLKGHMTLLKGQVCDDGIAIKVSKVLAATLCGSRPGVQAASPKTPKNTTF